MRIKTNIFLPIAAIILLGISLASSAMLQGEKTKNVRHIVTSDTILSGMIASLLPSSRYSIEAILPPGQCPGHYDVKLTDIEKTKKADLTVSFRGISFMGKADHGGRGQLLLDGGNRNWMVPETYIRGLDVLAEELSKRFPEDRDEILRRGKNTVRMVKTGARRLIEKIKREGLSGKAIIASSMQKEPLEWMGFRVVGEYGRPEAMSVREVVRLAKIGSDLRAVAVVDNLQSGPDAGKGIAETLAVPHVVLTNFPSEQGYLATLGENVDAIVAAVMRK